MADGLRRVPAGFVRDAFLAASPALVLVQWGVVRQLSHHAKLSVVWWPVAFVLVSTLLAAVIMWIAWSSRPLTRRGALLKQHLLGIEVFAEQTQLLDRGPSNDPALPFAVLGTDPGPTGRRATALLDAEIGDDTATREWRTPGYLTWPRLLVIGTSLLLLPGMIALIALVPNPYERGLGYAAFDLGTSESASPSPTARGAPSTCAAHHARSGSARRTAEAAPARHRGVRRADAAARPGALE